MSCNSCGKPFTLLRKEKGCPSCGFSYCSKCLDNKAFVAKLNAEAKVCGKCKKSPKSSETKTVEPPDAYYKRLGLIKNPSTDNPDSTSTKIDSKDIEIASRLKNLKEGMAKRPPPEEEIAQRLQKIKGEIPKTTDTALQERLANLRGVPSTSLQSQPIQIKPDLRTEQEQADDLMKQYLEQTNIDTKYKDEFDELVSKLESRLGNLKGAEGTTDTKAPTTAKPVEESESDDEETIVKKIVEKAKVEGVLEDELPPPTDDELPFCEICNEDAKMRCLGCKYLFCKQCFMDHKDDDDGCDKYELYKPPKDISSY